MAKKNKSDSNSNDNNDNSDAYSEYLKGEIENLKEDIFHENDDGINSEDGWGDDEGWTDDQDYEDLGEDGKEIYLNTQNIVKNADALPLCAFFLETRKRASKKSVLSWIKECDIDTLNMILEYVKEVREKDMVDDLEAKENTSDVFDDPNNSIDTEYLNREEDLYGLTALILAWEHDNIMIPASLLDKAVFLLAVYVVGEFGRRDGTIKITGNGTLLSTKTLFSPIKKTKKNFSQAMVNFSAKRPKTPNVQKPPRKKKK
jgi:hypothetical protein